MGALWQVIQQWVLGLSWDALIRGLLGVILALLGAGCAVEGVHSANPTTMIRVDPSTRSVYVSNNKDVDLSFEELTATKESFTVKNVKIVDKASSVREANVGQITALAEQAKAIGEAWSMGITAGANLASSLVPILGGIQQRPVWGAGQPGVTPPAWQYPPATQPAK